MIGRNSEITNACQPRRTKRNGEFDKSFTRALVLSIGEEMGRKRKGAPLIPWEIVYLLSARMVLVLEVNTNVLIGNRSVIKSHPEYM